MSKSGRVVVIGIDGGSPHLISKGIERHELDTFSHIKAQGVSGILESVKNPLTAPAWASFLTGRNPGKHGVFDFYKFKGTDGRVYRRLVNGKDIQVETIYETLSKQGKRVGLLNVPMTYPPKKVNGFVVTGLLTPPGRLYTYPPELQKELSWIGYIIELEQCYLPGKEQEYIRGVSEVRSKREDAFFHLTEQFGDPDFVFCVFRHIDLLSHALWKYIDPLSPYYTSSVAEKYKSAILDGYKATDRFLLKLIRKMDADDMLFVVSDHGFGPQRKKVNLSKWLCDEGYLKFKLSFPTYLKLFIRYLGISPLKIHEILTKSGYFQKAMRTDISTISSLYERLFLSYKDLDCRRTLVYLTGTSGGWGQIYLNRALGRNSLIHTVRKELSEITTQSGEKIVQEVYEKGEIYLGGFLDEAPDLLVRLKEGYASYPLYSDHKMISDTPPDTTGCHHEEGILYIYGSEISEGLTLNKEQIVDVTPTLLYVYNLPIPRDMDGRILLEAFKPGSEILARAPKYVDPSETDIKERASERVYTKEEEEEIKTRLRRLGYL